MSLLSPPSPQTVLEWLTLPISPLTLKWLWKGAFPEQVENQRPCQYGLLLPALALLQHILACCLHGWRNLVRFAQSPWFSLSHGWALGPLPPGQASYVFHSSYLLPGPFHEEKAHSLLPSTESHFSS